MTRLQTGYVLPVAHASRRMSQSQTRTRLRQNDFRKETLGSTVGRKYRRLPTIQRDQSSNLASNLGHNRTPPDKLKHKKLYITPKLILLLSYLLNAICILYIVSDLYPI